MPKYLVFSKLSAKACQAALADPGRGPGLGPAVEQLGGRIVDQFALLGDHDYCTVVDIRDNDTAQLLAVADPHAGDAEHAVVPAIDLALFTRLLAKPLQTTGPHRWQITPPACLVRRLARRYSYAGLADRYFQPYTLVGSEHFDGLRGPVVFIGNHASFMDGPAMYAALPPRYQARTAFPAAADRLYAKGQRDLRKQGWYHSLVFNSFPLQRGGGRRALAYADWLIDRGWSIGIFPEGARTSTHKLARFRAGPAILAVDHQLPVVPLYFEGVGAIRPKGSREMTPGPVTARVGPPLRFASGTDIGDATRQLHHAVAALADQAAAARRAARQTAVLAEAGAAPGGAVGVGVPGGGR